MYANAKSVFAAQLAEIETAGLWKHERLITSPQAAHITTAGKEVINFCANNYLGLSIHPRVIAAAQQGARRARLRPVERALHLRHAGSRTRSSRPRSRSSSAPRTRSSTRSCFDANGGLFETLLGEEDAIISDALNHASIIDGIRLCKAERHRYEHDDLDDLEAKLKATQDKRAAHDRDRRRVLDGRRHRARSTQICDLAEKYNALVMVDDSHATGFVGKTGRGTRGAARRAWIASTSSPRRSARRSAARRAASRRGKQGDRRSAAQSLAAVSVLEHARAADRRGLARGDRAASASRPRCATSSRRTPSGSAPGMTAAGLDDPRRARTRSRRSCSATRQLAADMAQRLLAHGIYVIGFSYPVVPKGQARIRVQLSAAHS